MSSNGVSKNCKKCKSCRKNKPFNQFGKGRGKNAHKRQGLTNSCNECRKENNIKRTSNARREGSIELELERKHREEFKENCTEISGETKKCKRKTISQTKQNILLDMQKGCCRGPGKDDGFLYECPFKRNDREGSLHTPLFMIHGYEVDHIQELQNGGTNELLNLQILCKQCHWIKTRLCTILKNDESMRNDTNFNSLYNFFKREQTYKSEWPSI